MQNKRHTSLVILLLTLVLIAVGTGSVYAYLSTGSGKVSNTLTPATPVIPTFSSNGDEVNVGVSTTEYGVYVRAAIVVSWKNAAGEIYAVAPVLGKDYTLNIETQKWNLGNDGFYYYTSVVPRDGVENLKSTFSCELQNGATVPEGYELSMEVIVQTIQAAGSTDGTSPIPAYQHAWGLDTPISTQPQS